MRRLEVLTVGWFVCVGSCQSFLGINELDFIILSTINKNMDTELLFNCTIDEISEVQIVDEVVGVRGPSTLNLLSISTAVP